VHQPSAAQRALLNAAVGAGAPALVAPAVVRGILATFADRIPEGERRQVASHLPADVRAQFIPPRRHERASAPRTVHELVAQIVATTPELPHASAEPIVAAVVATLRSLVPEEAGDVAAVLPAELRALWQGESAAWQGPTGPR
jgi:uncharacterized protein (DUF2267 family)